MRILVAASAVLLACEVSLAEEQLVREIRWSEIQQTGGSLVGELQSGNGAGPTEHLVISNTEDLPMTVSLLTLTEPKITATQYALSGTISYEGIHGTGYLEMWNHFPNGRAYFSKTLGDSGPMGSLRGTSSWRPFSLPFMSSAEIGAPNRLEFNLVLPGPGTVRLGDLRLVQYPDGFAAVSRPGAWWSDRTSVGIAAIGGTICGCLGALIGTLTSFGIARRFVLTLTLVIVAFGVTCLVLGGAALALALPYGVYYPLLLGGGICTVVFGALFPQMRQRYQQIEMRKMASMDVDALHA